MRFSWSIVLFAPAAALLFSIFARAQSPPAKPEVDPDAANYDPYRYTPPGVKKSVEIGNFYLKKKKFNAALSRFQEALAEDSTYPPAYLGLGKVYEKIGLKAKALDAYKKYLDTLPSEKDALDAKDAQHAVARLEDELKARDVAPRNPSAHP